MKFVFPNNVFDNIVIAELRSRGYNDEEAEATAEHLGWCARHGEWSRTLAKFAHMDDVTGSKVGGWIPGAVPRLLFENTIRRIYNAQGQLGLLTAKNAVKEGLAIAEEHGIALIEFVNAGHLMCAGHWADEIASNGFIGDVSCTSGTVEAAPHGGKKRTIGPNPFAIALPTREAIGFNVMIDTSATAYSMGKVAATRLEGKMLPPGVAIDEEGRPTTDPSVQLMLTFGEHGTTSHKLFGIGLAIELRAAFGGSSLPTIRGHKDIAPDGEECGSYFRFLIERPAGELTGKFPLGRTLVENVSAVYHDIMDPNPESHPPGRGKALAFELSERHGGILMTAAQVDEHRGFAERHGLEVPTLQSVEV